MRIGVYELIGRVSVGVGSTVWKGHDPALDRDVALKQLPSPTSGDRDQLRAEAEILAGLSHPGIVRVYDLIEDGQDVWLAQEWVDGAHLGRVADTSGRLGTSQALGIVRGALLGLAYAHQAGTVHGDFAPSNILVSTAGESKLIDFGLAGRAGRASIGGTPDYASPESLAGAPLSPAADVYSAAAVLARILRGQSVGGQSPRGMANDLGGVPDAVKPVLQRALDPDPAQRHPDAQAFLDDFDRAAERALGPGWWTTAGAGALATAATPVVLGVAGVGAAGGATLATGGAASLLETGATASARTKATGSGRLLSSKAGALIIVGTVVVLVAVSVGAVAMNRRGAAGTAEPVGGPVSTAAQDPGSAPPASTTPPPSVTPSPTPTPVRPLAGFSGRYKYLEVVTSTNNAAYKVGEKFSETWSVETTCTKRCTSEITDKSGEPYSLSDRAGSLSFSVKTKEECVDTKTRKPQGYSVPMRYQRSIKAAKTDADGAARMSGRAVYQQLKPCKNQGGPLTKVVYKITVTPIK